MTRKCDLPSKLVYYSKSFMSRMSPPGKPQKSVSEHCPSLALCLNHLLWKSILGKGNSVIDHQMCPFPRHWKAFERQFNDGTLRICIFLLTTYKMNTDILHHPNTGKLCFLLLCVGICACALTFVGVSVCWGQRTTWVLFLLRNYLPYVLLKQDL